MLEDPNAPARKRRRRRRGRPVGEEGTEAGASAPRGDAPRKEASRRKPDAKPASKPAKPASEAKPSLLGRIKAGLSSLVKRNPPGKH